MSYFSIIIPTLNEADYIGDLLSDLTSQTLTDFEVVIVDANSTDKTREIIKRFNSSLKLKFFSAHEKQVAQQRNQGARQSKSAYLLFMDADNRLDKDFLKQLKNQLKTSPHAVFTCKTEPDGPELSSYIIAGILNVYLNAMYWLKSPGALGALIGCPKELFNKETEFRSDIIPFEDGYFVRHLHHLGHECKLFDHPKFIYSQRRFRCNGYWHTLLHYLGLHFRSKVLRQQSLASKYKMGGFLKNNMKKSGKNFRQK